jgi:hypothetical protein
MGIKADGKLSLGTICSTKMLVDIQQTTQRYISETRMFQENNHLN